MLTLVEVSDKIKNYALESGFDGCGIAKVEPLEQEKHSLQQWLASGYHADMEYMARCFDKRTDPGELVPGAQSVISVILTYNTSEKINDPSAPRISKYAWGKDYHNIMKKKLKHLLGYIDEIIGPMKGRYFVDTAPVLDRVWAAKSGLGWIGKNACLISREWGSFIFIGELIIDKKLAYDRAIKDYCGTCTQCIEACPTGAIIADRIIDSTKCISYQTIENKGAISGNMQGKMENWVFGCDICQEVCPWNKDKPEHRMQDFNPHPDLLILTREEWFEMDEKRFNDLFSGTPVMRAKYSGLKRNLKFVKEQPD